MAKAAKVSPFAPKSLPKVPVIDGVRFATAEAGIRYQGRTDLLVAVLDEGTVCGGVTTKSKTCSAPVLWCREALKTGRARALVVNSGNANTFTGKQRRGSRPRHRRGGGEGGRRRSARRLRVEHRRHRRADGRRQVRASARRARQVGQARRVGGGVPRHHDHRHLSEARRRARSRSAAAEVTINGFCKGAGMIAPDMATMLCYIFTDAAIAQPVLQRLVSALRRPDLQLHHRRWRHVDSATRC